MLALLALGAPGMAWAQTRTQQARVSTLGVLTSTNPEPTLGFLREGLRALGWVEGKSLVIEVRSAEGKPNALPGMVAELVRMKVDLIAAYLTPAVQAAKLATNAIPIVMTGAGDPVATGLVASLARPGGNITGMSGTTAELAAKNLEIVREIRPGVSVVAVLANTADPFTKPFLGQLQLAGRAMNIEIRSVMMHGPEQYEAAFAELVKAKVDTVILQPSLPRKPAIDLALKHRLLLASPSLIFPRAGGLFAYAASPKDLALKASVYVDKILKGAKPSDLPIEQPTQFELVVNMKTAKALGIAIPRSVLVRADEVIE